MLPRVTISGILIRNAPGYYFYKQAPLTDMIRLFHNYFEASLNLIALGVIKSAHLWRLTRIFHNNYRISIEQTCRMMTDLMLRCDREDVRLEAETIIKRLGLPVPTADTRVPGPAKELCQDEVLRLSAEWVQKINQKT